MGAYKYSVLSIKLAWLRLWWLGYTETMSSRMCSAWNQHIRHDIPQWIMNERNSSTNTLFIICRIKNNNNNNNKNGTFHWSRVTIFILIYFFVDFRDWHTRTLAFFQQTHMHLNWNVWITITTSLPRVAKIPDIHIAFAIATLALYMHTSSNTYITVLEMVFDFRQSSATIYYTQ